VIPVAEVAQKIESAGLGFERVRLLPGNTFRDNSTVVVIPTRGMIHSKVVQGLLNLISPMNQKRALFFAEGDEVGVAYNRLVQAIIDNPQFNGWKYLLTIEDDQIVPPDAHIRLLETIEAFPQFDAVSGIYFTKGDFNMPMAYGDPVEYQRTGVLDFRPRNVQEALAAGQVMPVNGIAMGCGLWRLDMFRALPPPWFVTTSDFLPGKGVTAYTQDLAYCKRAREAGKKFAVDLRVRVGHLDVGSGIVY
jgi:hypothetical protein